MRELTQAERTAMAAVERWMNAYKRVNGRRAPSVSYEAGWIRILHEGGRSSGYRTKQIIEMAERLEGRAILAEASDA